MMAEILGVGLSHNPCFMRVDEEMEFVSGVLNRPTTPPELKDSAYWPEPMRREWGEDGGLTSAAKHRAQFAGNVRKIRSAIDDFKPDFLVIFGDDQYENFKEDCIPAFCVFAYEDVEIQPLMAGGGNRPNYWNEPSDKVFTFRGKREAAKHLAKGLLKEKFDIAYSYEPLHHNMGHAFHRMPLYLDYDRDKGFEYPIVPVAVNCYGSQVIARRGGGGAMEADLDPPSPTPDRCMELGAAVVRVLKESPWRAALVASSSWSHAFLTPKFRGLHPDVDSDKKLFDTLAAADYEAMHKITLDELEDNGQQECLNWFCLAGAMEELNRKPDFIDFSESYIFNSSKCAVIYKP
jgi:hypothetical protein